MNQFLHLLETLETHMDRIRTDLGADWPEFTAQIQSLAPAFEAAWDESALARAVEDLYMACRAREPVMAILRQTADTSGVEHDRKPPAGGAGYGDEIPVREVVNHFQSLLDSLEETEWSKEGKDQRGKDEGQSGMEDAMTA